ncbi:hypothetical protein [Peptacetobacter hiranonis]|uniref:Uncharacterized protein n=1 Tax=Peptacetobacter hiranonis (strain DSM 13275 / JCM 10541 / KCTC 15199 / TO-931) TaxID=500633 RepID=B6FWY9_PEPHT|nr:hypothetical protein [Peptacetobacter hiranonis]EEA86050.1 hypothetical protein CLOHIR_00388 [Peptacetobacter hiranonis DSM 13275]QEK21063.1 hypothetical protein KGNDJEFE_01550 [Peptacetobacter hiranonis]
MDLKNTINNTNTQKENLKTVANNIDNKLVELGGERATDLADVVNKMDTMVGQYKKIAEGEYNSDLKVRDNDSQGTLINNEYLQFEKKIPLNLNFTPKRIIFKFEYMNHSKTIEEGMYAPYGLSVDSKHNYNISTSAGIGNLKYPIRETKVFVKNITSKEATIVMTAYKELNYPEYFFMKAPIKWTAIG